MEEPVTARSLPEWIGKTADEKIPPRVRLRVFDRAKGHCQSCTRKIMGGDAWQADHVKAIINGGQNREANLQLLCGWCHAEKTRSDVGEKAATYRKRSRDRGIKKPRSITRWRGFDNRIIEKPRER
jgi:5-methylcytosine-specific restriction protein A